MVSGFGVVFNLYVKMNWLLDGIVGSIRSDVVLSVGVCLWLLGFHWHMCQSRMIEGSNRC